MTKGTEINFSPDIYRCQLENVDEAEEFEVIGLKVTLEEEKVEPQLTKLIFEKKKARKFSNLETHDIQNISLSLNQIENQMKSQSC
mmetsp:Transcript_21309/g.23716  ORF Transcript_21309/g.23716 Transcript_21309/m.23716 type:complete len:86 (-) Transcript_21309:392-649(-)